MNRKKTASCLLAAAALAAGLAASALALEISLEENKASRGNIGYVDIHKVFHLFPETAKAKQSYQEIVRQAEEQVNLRKAELLTLRAELSRFKLERELLEKTPIPAAPPEAALPSDIAQSTAPRPSASAQSAAPAASTPPQTSAELSISSETRTAGLSEQKSLVSLPGMQASTGTAPSAPEKTSSNDEEKEPALPPLPGTDAPQEAEKPLEPLVIDIPGVTEKPIVVDAPDTPPTAAPRISEDAGKGTVLAEDSLKARAAKLAEFDEKIKARQAELALKEEAFRAHQEQLEKDLLDIENRRSEMLLGKIYDAIREVARESGVSVVVDKSQILFGQDSVDLTDKVVKKLQELPS